MVLPTVGRAAELRAELYFLLMLNHLDLKKGGMDKNLLLVVNDLTDNVLLKFSCPQVEELIQLSERERTGDKRQPKLPLIRLRVLIKSFKLIYLLIN